MQVRLRPFAAEDAPRVAGWLQAGHVRRWWGEPEGNGEVLAEPAPGGDPRAIIELDGRPVGLLVRQHPSRRELDEAGLCEVPTTVLDIDVMIGEPLALGRGVGAAALRLAAEEGLADPAVPFVMAASHVDNRVAHRAFARAGFRPAREFDDGPPAGGRYLLLVRERT